MEREQKLKILKQLSQTSGDKAVTALVKEVAKAGETLSTETDYYLLKSVLEELAIYAFRIHGETIKTVSVFLRRTDKSVFVKSVDDRTDSSGFQVQQRLSREALEIVEGIRYFNITAALDIFCAYSAHSQEALRKKALEGLKKCATFEIDIYYSGEGRAGLGEAPQLEVLNYLEQNHEQFAGNRVEAAATLASELLCPAIKGTSWDYKTVTWSTGVVPFSDQLSEIRTRTLQFLMKLHRVDLTEGEKSTLISALWKSTDVPREGKVDPKWSHLIESNTLLLFDWIKSVLPCETLPFKQRIEHNVYWRYYHGFTNSIKKSALDIRDILANDKEFQIYRDLIGFESIFEDWEESLKKSRDFSKIDEQRNAKAAVYVSEISSQNWPQWRDRIFRYCETRSNDLAMFPIYHEFLFKFAKAHPKFAFELVSEHLAKVELFTIPLFRGLWNSELREVLRPILIGHVEEGNYLVPISKAFMSSEHFDREVLEKVLDVGSKNADVAALSQMLLVAASNYDFDKPYIVKNLFMPTISKLLELGDTDWVHQIWYGREMRELAANLNAQDLDVFLGALEMVDHFSFQTEELLKAIAEGNPKRIIDFFGNRIRRDGVTSHYEAVPFDMHALAEPLSKHPSMIIDTVKSWDQHRDSLFQYRGGRFVASLFPTFGSEFESVLMPLAKSGNNSDTYFVIGILRNYHGQTFLHNVCRELIISNFESKSLTTDVAIVLCSTGVVTGEYGFADAYARKAQEIKYWLSDENEYVREFARWYIEMLAADEARERERSDESIELRKHKFGVKHE